MKKLLVYCTVILLSTIGKSQGIVYPHPVQFLKLTIEQQEVKMAYMDVRPTKPNGQAVLLLHGKNFNGYYWKDAIQFLTSNGYRVIVPDQVGWGRSDKPNIHYSFHLLADNTKKLLDTLQIKSINVVGHSMGGMLAARFALMYPASVSKLVFENPIGLEDYKTFVPYQPTDVQFANELKATQQSITNYQKTYYPQWKPEYQQYADAQYAALQLPNFRQATWASALTYQMIYEQPVVYEFKNIKQRTLIIIGLEDRTVVGKNLLTKEEAAKHGHYPTLGKWLKSQISSSRLSELKGVGHIPHLQVPSLFHQNLLKFLKE